MTDNRIFQVVYDTDDALADVCVPAGAELQIAQSAPPWINAAGTFARVGAGLFYYLPADGEPVEGFLAVKVAKPGFQTSIAYAKIRGASGKIWIPIVIRKDGALFSGANPVGVELRMTLDGAAFVAPTGTFTEVGDGLYYYLHDVLGYPGKIGIKLVANDDRFDEQIAWGSLEVQPRDVGPSVPVPGPPTVAAEGYARMLMALLPPGKVWRLVDSMLSELFAGCADELGRLHERVNDLFDEDDPSKADELLPEYEREIALDSTGTNEERQARIVARLVARQRVRPSDYQAALAPLLGQLPADVVVLERTHAMADAMGDDREIFRFFIYRDPALPGDYFLDSAQQLVDKISHSHTVGQVIESVDFLCDDEFSLCDRDLLGA